MNEVRIAVTDNYPARLSVDDPSFSTAEKNRVQPNQGCMKQGWPY